MGPVFQFTAQVDNAYGRYLSTRSEGSDSAKKSASGLLGKIGNPRPGCLSLSSYEARGAQDKSPLASGMEASHTAVRSRPRDFAT